MSQQQYVIVKKFVGGMLEGLTYTETTTVEFEVGQVVEPVGGSSPYEITHCAPVTDEAASMLRAARNFRKGA